MNDYIRHGGALWDIVLRVGHFTSVITRTGPYIRLVVLLGTGGGFRKFLTRIGKFLPRF